MLGGVEVVGLKELRRALNQIDPELTKTLRGELLEIGKDIAADTQRRVPTRTGNARRSIRPGVSGNNAYVAGGKKTVPYYGWLDFGTRTPRSGRPRSVGPWRGTGAGPRKGRFIYVSIEQNNRMIERRATKAFDNAKKSAFH